MRYLLILVAATAISSAVVPIMVRLAPRLGMMDHPDSRKVHLNPVPRVGGWGIIAGSVLSVLFWAPIDHLVVSYVFGSLILLVIGAWDDRKEVGPYAKFLAQTVAVTLVATYGGLYITAFPFLDEPLPPAVGIPFTVFAMVGMINALNTSDGLDGLAGGLSLLSLATIAFLAYLVAGNNIALVIVVGLIGATFGFLRYNTHPANVFMGDAGSQFLGFNLGFLVILLTQRVDTNIAPIVVLFLLGLPVTDLIVVIVGRARRRARLFQPTKDHLHHRIMHLGFPQQESVVIIYALQALLVLAGIYLRYEQEWVVALVYLTICTLVYASLHWAENTEWTAPNAREKRPIGQGLRLLESSGVLVWGPREILALAIPIYLVSVSLWVNEVPQDFGYASAVLFCLVLMQYLTPNGTGRFVRRGLVYITAVFVVYLYVIDRPSWSWRWVQELEVVFYGLVATSIAAALRFSPGRRKREFRSTGMDYLLILFVLGALLFMQSQPRAGDALVFIVVGGVILYSCEFLIVERREKRNWIDGASLITLAIIAARGLDLLNLQFSMPKF